MCFRGRLRSSVCLIQKEGKLGICIDLVRSHVGDKRGRNLCAVFVGDRLPRGEVITRTTRNAIEGQGGSEEEEVDAVRHVESHDLREDGKGRVINHNAPRRIDLALIIATGEEGAHDLPPLQAILLYRPTFHRLIHGGGSVAIVRGLFRLEFLGKCQILGIILSVHLCILFAPPCLLCLDRALPNGPAEKIQLLCHTASLCSVILRRNPR